MAGEGDKEVRTGVAPAPQGGKTPERLAVIRALLARCWPHSRIKDELTRQWGITRRTVDRYIRIVAAENRRDYESSRMEMLPELIAQMRAHYDACMKAEQFAAAGKYFDRMIQMTGLDIRRVEITGANQGPVVIAQVDKVDLTKLSEEQLLALGQLFERPDEDGAPETSPTH